MHSGWKRAPEEDRLGGVKEALVAGYWLCVLGIGLLLGLAATATIIMATLKLVHWAWAW